ncbi:hypothetical protein CHF27_000400 [Romboutsia maritimum]|uniref:Regulatory protein YrvL n=1 Tax=Romboutsia maritimum TaxID=2020948 RepID=A0A371IW31_9FIRM|nr:hypothetical protein CHF27_000400 [Romboutsia maritimum]
MINIKNKNRILEFISLFLFFAFFLIIEFFIFTLVGIGFLSFLGFDYNSFWSVILFFVIYFCAAIPTDFLCIAILDIFKYINKFSYFNYKILEFITEITLTFITINFIDFLMNCINIPLYTEVLFSILNYLLSQCIDFLDKDKNKDSISK